ncbi:MAG: response regulator [Deltaproteobacteria bacterium]|nr:response regulator [Deltaproteobacteria bacterium]
MRVLIVENGATQRQALAELLRDEGHEVAEASCPSAALELFANQPADVLLINYVLADGEAPGLIEQVRALETEAGRLPCDVVCISGATSVRMTTSGPVFDDYRDTCRRMGVAAFFPKPVDFERLSDFLADRGSLRVA